MSSMRKKTVMGVYAPPPRLVTPIRAGLVLVAVIAIVGLGLLLDPLFRNLLGL